MIEAVNLTKKFDNIVALDNVTASIKDGEVFGLIGTNGAGKSTFLRCAAGIYRPDGGEIRINGESVFENNAIKGRFFFISDDQFFFPNANALDMAASYKNTYRNFDMGRYRKLLKEFGLDERRKLLTFSKGMKKQVSIILALSAMTEYIFCDETFDGLDPVMRQAVKSLFAYDMESRGLTPIIASHNLRELEDICDHVGLLHKGGILLSKDLDDLKLGIHKVQCVLKEGMNEKQLFGDAVVKSEKRGRLINIIIKGDEDEIKAKLEASEPVFYELLPLSLEEIFITETEVVGYDVKKLILGESQEQE